MFSLKRDYANQGAKYRTKTCFLKTYDQLLQVEQAIKIIKESSVPNPQLSILGKLDHKHWDDKKDLENKKKRLKAYWKNLLGAPLSFGLFSNPEFGFIFIVGSLVSVFLHTVGKKKLGAMSAGPYGILRGLGIHEKETTTYLKNLNRGDYLLILRGYPHELDILERLLGTLDETA